MNYQDICRQSIELVRQTGKLISLERESFNPTDVEVKGLHNYVTAVDKMAEEKLVQGLEKILPEAGFIAEEGTSSKKGENFNWIIDPIDGTTNFIHGIPAYAISIGLMQDDHLVMGIVYEITGDEMFYAWKDSPAYLNGQEISVSNQNDAHFALMATGFPYSEYEQMDSYINLLKTFMKTTSGMRRIGSAAVDLVYVACGRFEGFYEYNLNAWDVAGGAFIVQQAGGFVSDWKGGNDFVFGRTILASNKVLHESFLKTIQEAFHQ